MAGDPLAAPTWLIYALGSGLGHVVRGVALARAAERRGHQVRLIASSRQARHLPVAVLWLEADGGRAGLARQVRDIVLQPNWEVVIVDTFPRGLLGELASLLDRAACPKVLVHRDISPVYWQRFGLAQFALAYDLVLLPGERGPLAEHPSVVHTTPWLVRDDAELLAPGVARSRLGVDQADQRPLVLVSASGTEAEIAEAGGRAARLRERFPEAIIRTACPAVGAGSMWPLLELLPGVDALVGAGGYNTVYEARCTHTPLIAIPRRRLYDRQARRLHAQERVLDEEHLLGRISQLLAASPPRPTPAYRNGVHDAVQGIERLLADRGQATRSESVKRCPRKGCP